MRKPYGIVSDIHLHNWSAFATVGADGINSRLQILLNELHRCADEVDAAGGDTIINAGDTFHVRGNITPSVLNPTLDAYSALVKRGFKIYIVAGNHDLEGKDSDRLGSAVTALEGVGCAIVNTPAAGIGICDDVVMVPWIQNIGDLKKALEDAASAASTDVGNLDLVIHAPIDDVLVGIPDHGLTSDYLASLGFRKVFAGHYHHHKNFGNKVYSIGALAHHTWSDVGSKAGFLIVRDAFVEWRKSHAPEFIDLLSAESETDAELMAEGNYVRARVTTNKMQDINKMREWLEASGAKGILIQSVKEPVKAREGSIAPSVTAGASIGASVDEYIKGQTFAHAESVQRECQRVLSIAGI